MKTVFRAHDVPQSSRVEYWQHVVQKVGLPLRGRHATTDFRAQMVTGDVGAIRVLEGTTPAGECYRTRGLIAESNQSLCEIDVVVSGQVIVEQENRQAHLRAGDLAFVDPAQPVRYRSSQTTHVTMLFPRSMLPMRPEDLRQLTGVRVPGDHGAGALASTLARQLPRHVDDRVQQQGARLGVAVIDLLAVALSTRLGASPPADAGREALFRQIYAFIDENIADTGLDPAAIAAAHHISLRYLHALFQTQESTVAEWIRTRRLALCRNDLLDPGQANRPVGAIAAGRGLPNQAHFSRIFKAAYGMPPAEFRHSAGVFGDR
jgi:AraC-like DNA-binding protein